MKSLIKSSLALVLFIAIISCSNNKNEKLIKDLQGDWIYTSQEMQYISIKDSLFFGWEHYNKFEPFIIRNDTLFVPSYDAWFPISRITEKYFWTKGKDGQKDYPLLYNTKIYHNEIIKLISLEIRISNYGGRGFLDWGLFLNDKKECFLTVKGTRRRLKNIFNPFPYDKGEYFTSLSKIEFDFIQNKFRNIPLNKINYEYISEHYEGHGNYDNTTIRFECKFGYNDSDQIRTLSFTGKGYEGLPAFLGIFVNYLNKIPTFIKFEETTKTHEFKFYDSKYQNWNR